MKSYAIIFSTGTFDDVEKAVAYYEENQTGLGKLFVTKLQLTLNAIKRNPLFATVRYNDIHCTSIKKFPYQVHYHINDDELKVTIIAVYSTYKEPIWQIKKPRAFYI